MTIIKHQTNPKVIFRGVKDWILFKNGGNHFGFRKEIGGIIFFNPSTGNRIFYQARNISPLNNVFKMKVSFWQLLRIIYFIMFRGYETLGTWHTHPSGDPKLSEEDVRTELLRKDQMGKSEWEVCIVTRDGAGAKFSYYYL